MGHCDLMGNDTDLIIVDDPICSRQEAESETSRNSLWKYFHSDLLSCLLPHDGAILFATACHERDLAMRLEREQSDIWRMVRLCAVSVGEDVDPLRRPSGVPLWDHDESFGSNTSRSLP